MIIKLFEIGKTPIDLAGTIEIVCKLSAVEMKLLKMTSGEKDTLTKNLEGFRNRNKNEFQQLLDTLKQAHKNAQILRNFDEKDDEEGILGYAKTHKKEIAGVALAGAIGYGLYRWIKGSPSSSPAPAPTPTPAPTASSAISSVISTAAWGGVGVAAAGGAFALGVMLGPSEWRQWVREKLHLNISFDSICPNDSTVMTRSSFGIISCARRRLD